MSEDNFFSNIIIPDLTEITLRDFKKVLTLIDTSLILNKKDDLSMTKQEKIDSYKAYCRKYLEKEFENLVYDDKVILNKFFNMHGTKAIQEHLED